jgi:hypothetical protein
MPCQAIDLLNAMTKSAQRVRLEPIFSLGNTELTSVDDDNIPTDSIYGSQPMRLITNSHVAARDSLNSIPQVDELTEDIDVVNADDLTIGVDPESKGGITATDDNADRAVGEPRIQVEPARVEAVSDPIPPSSPIVTVDELPEPQVLEPSAAPPTSRYNLLGNRSYGRRDGHWRTKKEQKHYGLHITAKKVIGTYGQKAVHVKLEELKQMLDKEEWEPVAVTKLTYEQRKSIIRSSIFLRKKFTSAGVVDKLKVRLIAGGNMQDKSLYDDVSSPIVATTSVMIVAAIAAKKRRSVVTADIGGAYVKADMTSSIVFMKLDPNCLQC